MKTKSKMKWLGAAVAALLGLAAGRAEALTGTSSYLNIDVTIVKTLSVSVNTVNLSSQAVTWSGGATIVSPSTVTVTNDSGFFAESWKLNTLANAFDAVAGGAGWAIATTPGIDTVEIQAVFGPTVTGTDCTGAHFATPSVEPALTAGTVGYTSTVLNDVTWTGGSGTFGPDSGTLLNAGSSRPLCWKMSMPTSNSKTNQQIVPIIVTAF